MAPAQPVGALIAGAFVALRRDIRRQGVVLLTALIAWRYPRLRQCTSDMADEMIKATAS